MPTLVPERPVVHAEIQSKQCPKCGALLVLCNHELKCINCDYVEALQQERQKIQCTNRFCDLYNHIVDNPRGYDSCPWCGCPMSLPPLNELHLMCSDCGIIMVPWAGGFPTQYSYRCYKCNKTIIV